MKPHLLLLIVCWLSFSIESLGQSYSSVVRNNEREPNLTAYDKGAWPVSNVQDLEEFQQWLAEAPGRTAQRYALLTKDARLGDKPVKQDEAFELGKVGDQYIDTSGGPILIVGNPSATCRLDFNVHRPVWFERVNLRQEHRLEDLTRENTRKGTRLIFIQGSDGSKVLRCHLRGSHIIAVGEKSPSNVLIAWNDFFTGNEAGQGDNGPFEIVDGKKVYLEPNGAQISIKRGSGIYYANNWIVRRNTFRKKTEGYQPYGENMCIFHGWGQGTMKNFNAGWLVEENSFRDENGKSMRRTYYFKQTSDAICRNNIHDAPNALCAFRSRDVKNCQMIGDRFDNIARVTIQGPGHVIRDVDFSGSRRGVELRTGLRKIKPDGSTKKIFDPANDVKMIKSKGNVLYIGHFDSGIPSVVLDATLRNVTLKNIEFDKIEGGDGQVATWSKGQTGTLTSIHKHEDSLLVVSNTVTRSGKTSGVKPKATTLQHSQCGPSGYDGMFSRNIAPMITNDSVHLPNPASGSYFQPDNTDSTATRISAKALSRAAYASQFDRFPGDAVSGLQVYPNPATDQLHLKLPASAEGMLTVEILLPSGQVLQRAEYPAHALRPLATNFLSPGLYLLRIRGVDLQYQERLIIH